MFPNPTNNSVNIDVVNPSNEIKLSIFDLSGHEVFRKTYTGDTSGKSGRIALNAKDLLPTGMYMVSVSTNNTEYKKKLVLN